MDNTNIDRTKYFEGLGENFEVYMNDYDVQRRQYLIFSQLLKDRKLKDAGVLEVGCGTGRFSEQIVGLGAELTVLDIGPKLVDKVSRKLSCDGVVGDACNLPFADESFDIVISSECIEHTLHPEQAIREMCRVCRSGGLVCVTSPNRLWYPVLVAARKLGLRKFSGIENWIYPRRAATVMRQEGMTNIVISGCHLWPFQLKFTQPMLRRLDAMGKKLYPCMINFGILGQKGSPRD
ncbi:MAG: class I SAM-dependent methyltransferase [Phycisphaerae bacterium]|nr:class I SAM-dependent methyltransferase [Phycisphaerae bacterium]